MIDLMRTLTLLNYFCRLLDPQVHKRLTGKREEINSPGALLPFRNKSTDGRKLASQTGTPG